ncbi:paraquat-inducible protein A [Rhabdochromatium marinum]|uniref:paraquat-inducible protein A n=1 Tax=Rhabdochromatium marinum TaxID=48729 RepID=UPI0019087B87|nr:paraquat-inducible protein A [Rhabdochromatium marinum]MBK1649913.1 hypothetical protein [Rhabdochromatium marinum]
MSVYLCPECDLLQQAAPVAPGSSVHCARCGFRLHRAQANSLDRTLALTLAGVILFIIANSFPFLSFQMQGQVTETTLSTGIVSLFNQGKGEVALVVFFTSILAPGLQLALLLMVLVPLKLGRFAPWLAQLMRLFRHLRPWGMMDVFLIGILVSVVKLTEMATIVPGVSLFAFVVLIFVLAAAQSALDPEIVWQRVPLRPPVRLHPRAGEAVLGCETCELVVPEAALRAAEADRSCCTCPRCGSVLHHRKPLSLQRTWALVIAALAFYIPANVFPIMTVTSLGNAQSDTILSGVIFLLNHGMWPLALVVFVASIFVPLLKLLILFLLLISVRQRWRWRPVDRTRLYRMTEAIGRWSMVDVYVVTILVALVHLGNLASIQAEAGAVFFCAVVIITMLAAMSFDPRLIWDTTARPAAPDPPAP